VSKGDRKSGKNSEAAGEANKKEKRGKNPPKGQVETGAQQRGREREFKRLQRQTENLIGGFKYSRQSEVALVSPPPSSADREPQTTAVSGGGGRHRFWKSRAKNNNNNNNNKETLHTDRKDR
jgi:hypothetical protein